MAELLSIENLIHSLQKCRKIKDLAHAKRVHAHMCNNGLESHKTVGNYLVPMFVKCGSVSDAQHVFNRLAHRNEHSWTSLILGYIGCGQSQHALDLYEKMQEESVHPSSYTLMALLKACARLKDVARGQEIHVEITQRGFERDIFVGSTLVDMYAKCGSLDEANEAFDKMPIRNVVSWAALIAGYTEHGRGQDALKCFEQMQLEGLSPDAIIFVCILKACGTIGALDKGRVIHTDIAQKGLERGIIVGNTLVDMYAKCGSLAEAREAFDKLLVRDVVSWTALIAGYADHGSGQEALNCGEQMQLEGISPDAVTFICILKACGSIGAVDKGREIHVDIALKGFERCVFVGNTLVDMYAKCGSLAEAREAFDKLPIRDVVSWNALIAGYTEHGAVQEVLTCFEQMGLEGLSPDAVTFVCALKACGTIRAIDKGREIHVDVAGLGYEGNTFVGNSLVDMYAKCGSLAEAWEVFEKLPVRDVVSWNALIAGHAEHGPCQETLKCFEQMQVEGMAPDPVTFVCALKACGNIGAIDKGREMHTDIAQAGFEDNVFVGNTLVDMYAKCGSFVEAREVFDKLPIRDVVSWNALIAGFAEHGPGQEALTCFEQMQLEDVSPDAITFVSILKACSSIGAIDKGRELHADITQRGFERDIFVGSTLIDMYAQCGSLLEARNVFDKLPVQAVVPWNAMIKGYGINHEANMAVQCFEDMQKQGVKPVDITFTCLLNACSRTRLVLKGQEFFKMMTEQYGIAPSIDHYICMVVLLAQSGHLCEAQNFLESMPCPPLWTALLSACQVFEEAELGLRCFQELVQLNAEYAAPYVLMSKLYSNAGRWDDAYRIEKLRKHAGAKKKRASALIEVNNKVHEFVVGDDQNQEISSTLEILSSRMKEEGHVPSVSLVVRSISDEEEEATLTKHGENLVIACGLLDTLEGQTLRVTNILSDCHNTMNIMSRIERQEIIVQDAYHIHNFNDNFYSHGDMC